MMAAARRDVEGPVHRSILGYLRVALPHGAARTLHHSRNEGANAAERRKAAELGTKPGYPDIQWNGRLESYAHYSAFLEVKPKGRTTSPEQDECHDALIDTGAFVGVARSIDDARAFLIKHKIPTRDAEVERASA